MALPTWDYFMVPVLRATLDGQVHRLRALCELVADAESLSDDQRAEVLPSGGLRHQNRIEWATTYLFKAGALERPARGTYAITAAGRELLASHPDGITERNLRTWTGNGAAATTWAAVEQTPQPEPQTELDPVEQVETGVDRIHADVKHELLLRIHAREPAFFEQAVLDLLVGMGYGGGDLAVTRTQLSNDHGIDGIIDQDILGLSRVYVQAKRYAPDNPVGRPDIQSFVGALHGQQANQGVFITTGRFSKGAIDYAAGVATRVVLIDGARLAELMIRYGIGVQTRRTFTVVEIDEDFFE
ncbi:restriction endonuclease [Nakamurella sp. A5-74]|uniref:Restriction endonuclease n=1 Tax=Nakamurella sp. A5-74 TaxID=3158264 RepID=A0AAU8DS03_9ACTN